MCRFNPSDFMKSVFRCPTSACAVELTFSWLNSSSAIYKGMPELDSKKHTALISSLKILLPVALMCLTVGYIVMVINPVPLSDEWRWMKDLLIPFEQGSINFWQYITGEYAFLSHSHYFTLLFILADYHWFGLDFSHMAYAGLVAYILTWCMLVWYYLSLHNYQLNFTGYAGLIILTLAYASPLPDFPWGLVLFEYIYYFFAIGLLCLFDLTLREKVKFETFLVAFLFSVIFTETIGLIAVLAILAWSTLGSLTKRYPWEKTGILWLSFIVLLIVQYIILGKGIGGESSLLKSALALTNNPEILLKSFLATFAQPLADQTLLSESKLLGDNFRFWHLSIGALGLVTTVICLGVYIADKGSNRSQLPLLLAIFGVVAWATILLSRHLEFGPYIFDARRFTRLFTVYYISIAIALSLSTHSISRPLSILVLAIMSLFFCNAIKAQYSRAIHVQSYFDTAEKAIKSQPLDNKQLTESIHRCQPGFCEDTIFFLREEKVSVFNP